MVQKKQSQVQHAKYAAVHESRTAEDRRTAAELSARLLKLRNEHKETAAHVASELNQGPVSSGEPSLEGAAEPMGKQKEPWHVKVSCTACILVIPDFLRCTTPSTPHVETTGARDEYSDCAFVQVVHDSSKLELFGLLQTSNFTASKLSHTECGYSSNFVQVTHAEPIIHHITISMQLQFHLLLRTAVHRSVLMTTQCASQQKGLSWPTGMLKRD